MDRRRWAPATFVLALCAVSCTQQIAQEYSAGNTGSGAHNSSSADGGSSSTSGNTQMLDDGGSSSGSGGSGSGGTGSGGTGSGGTGSGGSTGGGGTAPGEPIACSSPSTSYVRNGGACGSERWDIKTGTDPAAKSMSMVPKSTTIATLTALTSESSSSTRVSPTETTVWELKDVTMTMIKLESDSDYHVVVTDGGQSMIVEVPYPSCATSSAWSCFIENARSTIDAKLNVSTSPQYPAQTVTVRGVGFFDYAHGQTGEAPNSIELHSVLQICFGKGCTPT